VTTHLSEARLYSGRLRMSSTLGARAPARNAPVGGCEGEGGGRGGGAGFAFGVSAGFGNVCERPLAIDEASWEAGDGAFDVLAVAAAGGEEAEDVLDLESAREKAA
jgi:hypothetical protein